MSNDVREGQRREFDSYVAVYNLADQRIALKVEHAYEVAALCDEIARLEGMSEVDADLAWLCGLLHDIGRFEQLRRWGTFRDSDSMSHADLGLMVLEGRDEGVADGRVERFTDRGDWVSVILTAVARHSDLRLPIDLDDRTRAFCKIVRDADKIDIIRVFASSECLSVLDLSPEEFLRGSISDSAMAAFHDERCLEPKDRRADLDGLVGALCLPFELACGSARGVLLQRGYLRNLLTSPFGLEPLFSNLDTREKWESIVSSLARVGWWE